jgi:hypothetical protein
MDSKNISVILVSAGEMTLARTAMGMGGEGDGVDEDGWIEMKKKMKRESLLRILRLKGLNPPHR